MFADQATLLALSRERRETRDGCGAAECKRGGVIVEQNTTIRKRATTGTNERTYEIE